MNLTKEISFLLYKHNCVIVPNFGAFILNEKSAEVNTLTNYASPKNRIVTFNSQINNNDGLLANHIKRNLGISYEDALDKIVTYVSDLDINNSWNGRVDNTVIHLMEFHERKMVE